MHAGWSCIFLLSELRTRLFRGVSKRADHSVRMLLVCLQTFVNSLSGVLPR